MCEVSKSIMPHLKEKRKERGRERGGGREGVERRETRSNITREQSGGGGAVLRLSPWQCLRYPIRGDYRVATERVNGTTALPPHLLKYPLHTHTNTHSTPHVTFLTPFISVEVPYSSKHSPC